MAHFADQLPGLPAQARAHMQRFRNLESTWKDCKHGVYMAWLLRVIAESEADRAELSRAATEATQKLQSGIEQYYKAVSSRDSSAPLPLAFRRVIDELAVACGTLEEEKLEKPPAPVPGEYDAYRAQALEVISDVIKRKIDTPIL